MLERFPPEGTRVVLLKDAGDVKAGSVGLVVKAMTSGQKPTPEDVFVLDYDGDHVWALRRHLALADDALPRMSPKDAG